MLRPRLIPVDYLKTQASLLHRDFSREAMIAYSLDLGKFDEFLSEARATKWSVSDAARLLLPAFRSHIADFVYAGIPNRDFLLLWSRDFAVHARFVAQIKKGAQTRL